jgi:hypothetical protein
MPPVNTLDEHFFIGYTVAMKEKMWVARIALSDQLRQATKIAALKSNMTLQQWVTEAVRAKLATQK